MAEFDLQGLLSQFGQVSDEDKRRALTQGLAAAGFGILGARNVNPWQAIGQGGLLGMGAYNGALDDVRHGQSQGLQNAMQAMQLKEGMQRFQDQDALRSAMQGLPQLGQNQPLPAGGMPTGDAASAMANGGPSAPPQMPSAVPSKRDMAALAVKQGDYLASKGFQTQAQQYYDKAEKLAPKLKDTRTQTDKNGNRVVVNYYDDGTHEILSDVGADKEKASFQNVGDRVLPLDPYTGKPIGEGVATGVSPDSQLSASTTMRGQNMTDARAREFNANAAANGGQVVETATGFARIGKDNTVTPIVSNGQQIQAKPTGTVQQALASNNVTVQKIDRALSLIDQHPDAFGMRNLVGDTVRQRTDPKGVAARAIVADIAGQKIHDRSGGAVSASESERLKPYVPNLTDDPAVVKEKLMNFKREYAQMNKELAGGASLAQVIGAQGGGATGGWTVKRVN